MFLKILGMDIDEKVIGKELEVKTIKGILYHRINVLKNVSQNVHGLFIALQGVEHQCYGALALLTPLHKQWGPYNQFFDKLITIMTLKKELPKEIIIPTRRMIGKVKEPDECISSKIADGT